MQSPLFHNKYRVLSARRPGWDYSDAAHYFITIVTDGRRNYFGDVWNGEMRLSAMGNIVHEEWVKTGEIRKDHVRLDEWIIMPNHIHMILEITTRRDEALPRLDTTTNDCVVYQSNNESRVFSIVINNPKNNPDNGDEAAPRLYGRISPKPQSLSSIIGSFKSVCTKSIHNIDQTFAWQPKYHDRIIRDDLELGRIRKYIRENPIKWEEDELFLA